MKVQISPPHIAVGTQPHGPEPIRQNHDRLDLTRQRIYGTKGNGANSESEVDEAAIALVELSVLVYDDLDAIGKTTAKLSDPCLGLFGKKGNRDTDLQWLEREPKLVELLRNISQSAQRTSSARTWLTPRQAGTEAPGSPKEVLFRAVSGFKRSEKLHDSPAASQQTPPFEAFIARSSTDAAANHQAERDKRKRAPHALAIMHSDAGLICFRGLPVSPIGCWTSVLGPRCDGLSGTGDLKKGGRV